MVQDTHHVKKLLTWTYGLLPIIAGLDKFFNILVDWSTYLSPIFPVAAEPMMMVVGVIEIVAGILVFRYTRIGAFVVSAWLLLIAINLAIIGAWDIAVRDVVMAIGAYSLARLSV